MKKKCIMVALLAVVIMLSSCRKQEKKTIIGQDGKKYLVVDDNPLVKNLSYFGNGVWYYKTPTDRKESQYENVLGPILAYYRNPTKYPYVENVEYTDSGYWIFTQMSPRKTKLK